MSSSTPTQFAQVADVYDSLMSVVPYHRWVDYVESLWLAEGLQPLRVLDVACGTGNVTDELIRRGYEVTGVDYSPTMLAIAEAKQLRGGRFLRQDMRNLDIPPPRFDAAVCLFDSLNYLLTPADFRSALLGIARHLVPGGSLVFDMNTVRALKSGMFDQQGTGADDSLEFTWRSRWDERSRLCTIDMEFRTHGADGTRVFHETHMQRGYRHDELIALLDGAGFEVRGAYQSFTWNQVDSRSDRVHILAIRRPGLLPSVVDPGA